MRYSCRSYRGSQSPAAGRRGVAALDYILVLGVVLPMALVILRIAPQIIRSAYEMVCVLISWPFL